MRTPRHPTPLLAGLAVLAALAGAPLVAHPAQSPVDAGADAPRAPSEATSPAPSDEEGEPAARALGTELAWDELDRILLNRHAMSQAGRKALRHLVETRLLDVLASEAGLSVDDAEVDARAADLDRQLRDAGLEGGLESQLADNRLDLATFRRYLRLSLVQERLTRRALGLSDDAPVTPEQQQLWMDQVLRERGYEELPPPWEGGVVARCGPVSVDVEAYVDHLRTSLPEEDIRESCYQLLLLERVRARMPDLAPALVEEAVREEIARRRQEAERDPKNQGLPYETLLKAQGIRVDSLPRDPSIRVAALARLWVERSYDDATLRRTYEDERERFDGLYGEAVETWMLFVRGTDTPNELLPRTYEEAEAELLRLRPRLKSRETFELVAGKYSEEPRSRNERGRLGWVTRGDPAVPRALRDTIFASLEEPGTPPAGRLGRVVGPVRTPTGSALLWLEERRPAPTWERMAEVVKLELRRRFLEDALPRSSVLTYLDQ